MTITSKSFAKSFTSFFESDEYLNLVAKGIVPTIRTYECQFTFDSHWRLQHDIDFNISYKTKNYEELTFSQIESTFTTKDKNTLFIQFDYDAITRVTKDSGLPLSLADCNNDRFKDCYPIKTAFDIEVNNPIDELIGVAFPTARWTPFKYADRYKSILTKDEQSYISSAYTVQDARKRTIDTLAKSVRATHVMSENGKKKAEQRSYLDKEVVPKLNETDAITVIAGIYRQNERGTSLRSDLGGFVYTWKPPSSIIKEEQAKQQEQKVEPGKITIKNEPEKRAILPLRLKKPIDKLSSDPGFLDTKFGKQISPLNSAGCEMKPILVRKLVDPTPQLDTPKLANSTPQPQQIVGKLPLIKEEEPKNGHKNISKTGGGGGGHKKPTNKELRQHKPCKPIDFGNITSNNDFSNLDMRVFASEYDMLKASLASLKRYNPDLIVGHNIMSFDLPYIMDRIDFLAEQDPRIKSELINNPFSFGFIKGNKARYYSYNFNRNNAQKTTWIVDSPGVGFFDSMKSFQHETFGKRSVSFALSALMPAHLNYPNSEDKMRKLEISILSSSNLWYTGGDGLAYFAGYCLFDALGSIMLAELLGFFDTIYFIAETTSAAPDSIYLRGVQNIIISMLHKMVWVISKKYLFPDYGIRELHFLDLWYWHYNEESNIYLDPDGNKKFKKYDDVRKLYETVPTLNRKWKMGGLRLIPDIRDGNVNKSTWGGNNNNNNNNNQQQPINDPSFLSELEEKISKVNPYLPKHDSEEYKSCCYSVDEIKKKQKAQTIPRAKAYMGARVFEVLRGFFGRTFILTGDFLSMYPTISVGFCLDFPNLVTEFTKRIFNIPRLSLMRVILGPKNLIQVGDVYKDAKMAAEKGFYDTDELVYVYYYQDIDQEKSILPRAIRNLLASRSVAKDKLKAWGFQMGRMKLNIKLISFLISNNANISNNPNNIDYQKLLLDQITTIRQTPADAKGKDTSSAFGGDDFLDAVLSKKMNTIYEFVDNIVFGFKNPTDSLLHLTKSEDANLSDNSYCEKLLFTLKNNLRRATVEESVANTDQNSKKLVMNSAYGGVSMSGGILPQIQLGSSITAIGRDLITRSERIIENIDLIDLVYELGLAPEIERIIGKSLSSIRERYIGKIYNSILTNGDTDSTIYALRDEILPCPETLDIVRKKINPYIANKSNPYLPKWYKKANSKIASPAPSQKPVNDDDDEFVIMDDRENGGMLFQPEKTSIATVNNKKKNYIQFTIEEKAQYKGVASKKSDTHPIAAYIEKEATSRFLSKPLDKTKNENTRTRVIDTINFIRDELDRLFSGDINPADYKMKMKLNKPIEAYKATGKKLPDHVVVACKKIARNQEVNIGDFISYVYTMDSEQQLFTKAKIGTLIKHIKRETEDYINPVVYPEGGSKREIKKKETEERKSAELAQKFMDLCTKMITNISYQQISDHKNVEDADYALANNIPLDILYYLEFKILPKLSTLVAPLIHSYTEYPRCPYVSTKAEKKRFKNEQKKIEVSQAAVAYNILTMGTIKDKLNALQSYRLQREVLSETAKMKVIYMPNVILHRCLNCNLFYQSEPSTLNDPMLLSHFMKESKEEPGFFGICPSCASSKTKVELVDHYKTEITKGTKGFEECEKKCWSCIKNTRVSMKSSMVHQKESLSNTELYYIKPSDCTMETCDVHKEKKLHTYKSTKAKQNLKLVEKIYDW